MFWIPRGDLTRDLTTSQAISVLLATLLPQPRSTGSLGTTHFLRFLCGAVKELIRARSPPALDPQLCPLAPALSPAFWTLGTVTSVACQDLPQTSQGSNVFNSRQAKLSGHPDGGGAVSPSPSGPPELSAPALHLAPSPALPGSPGPGSCGWPPAVPKKGVAAGVSETLPEECRSCGCCCGCSLWGTEFRARQLGP